MSCWERWLKWLKDINNVAIFAATRMIILNIIDGASPLPSVARQGDEMSLNSQVPRAIALCGSRTGLTEEEAQPIVIIECSAEFAAADAIA